MKTKKNYITVLSIFACFGVVLLHTNGCFWKFSQDSRWISANIIESVLYFSAPVFFMISGATLIDYRQKHDTKTYFKKRFTKIIPAFIFWTLAYLALKLIMGSYSLSDITPVSLFNNIFNTKYLDIYWFFINLISIYLSIPVLGAIKEESRRKVFRYIIVLSVCSILCYPFYSHLQTGN